MNFKTYIENVVDKSGETVTRTQAIDFNTAIKLITENCKQITNFYKAGNGFIYRGVKNFSADYGLVNPSEYIRTSKNTSNYYTLLFDNILLSWNSFPKRSKSIICSNNIYGAKAFGSDPVIIFPYDSAKIAICPRSDFWIFGPNLYKKMNITDLDNLNRYLLRPLYLLSGNTNKVDDWQSLLNGIETAQSLINSGNKDKLLNKILMINREDYLFAEDDGKFAEFIDRVIESGTTIRDYFETNLGPNVNGFKLWELPRLDLSNSENEVWTDAKCVLVKHSLIQSFLRNLK